MKNAAYGLLATVSILFLSSTEAQEPAPRAAAESQSASPALWVVKDDDTTVYLFGTVHALRPGLSWFDGAVREAFDRSEELVLEIDQNEAAGPDMQNRMLTLGAAQDGIVLSERLNEQQRGVYAQAMGNVGIPVAAFERFEPWVPGVLLSAMSMMQRGYDPAQGVEMTLRRAQTESGKRFSALETVDFQLGLFDALPMEAQVAFLNASADAAIQPEDQLALLVDLWAAGDPDGLGKKINAEFVKHPHMAEPLLYNRNRNWADWVQGRLAETGGIYFVAVGAGHLAGRQSLQDILNERGVTVERVR